MKKTLKIVFICMTLTTVGLMSCNKDLDPKYGYSPNPESEIAGSWKLTEVLADPGNGSGTFQPVTSDKVIQIFADSTFMSNGQMCNMNSDTIGSEFGYLADSVNITLVMSPCWGTFPITYQITGNELILTYPCIEACRQKYVRL